VSQDFEDGVLRDGAPPAQLCCGLVTGKKIQTTQITGLYSLRSLWVVCIPSRIRKALVHKIKTVLHE
jgi:hypothetical protein